MASPTPLLARLSGFLHRGHAVYRVGSCAVRNPVLFQYAETKRCLASAAADDIQIAETTADKREKHGLDDGSGAYGGLARAPFVSPELLPPMGQRSKIKDYLERQDCYRRRRVLHIPEFYVGTLMAVTMADGFAKGKSNRFAGICTRRGGFGLGATFTLRNVIDSQGVEVCYELYNPLVQRIEVLRLEKRLDADLKYLQDALPEYSTVDPDMVPIKHPPGKPVPVNPVKVKMKPKPWYKRWEREELNGLDLSALTAEALESARRWHTPEHRRMDLLQRWQVPEETAGEVAGEVQELERELGGDDPRRKR